MTQTFFNKSSVTLWLLMILGTAANSQTQDFKTNYQLSNCQGEIPVQFKKSVLDKINADIAGDKGDPKDVEIHSQFYKSYRYNQNRLFMGGKILFGDEMSAYVNKIAHNLLDKAERPELKKELNFYVLKSDIVNALCMPDGTILVTVGLLSQIENEAQLAFVLAHEITHYTKQHAVNNYRDILVLKKEFKKSQMSYEEAIKQLSDYSKENELESDDEGYSMFTKAGYDSEEANKMLLVLQYSYLPFDEIKFSADFFNDEHYIIPASYFPDSSLIETVEDNSDEDDTYSTHPNIETRVKSLNDKESKSGVIRYFDEEEFRYINTKARFENQNIHLVNKNFIKAVYECYLLKKQFPENIYLDQCLAKGLYGASKMNTTRGRASRYENEIEEGNLSLLYKVFNTTMSNSELNVLALRNLLNLNDSAYNPFIKDLVYDLHHNLEVNYEDFLTEKKEKIIDSTLIDSVKIEEIPVFKILTDEEYSELTKVQKIRYNEKKKKYLISIDTTTGEKIVEKIKEVEIDGDYYLRAFLNSPHKEKLKSMFDEAESDESNRYFSELSFTEQNKLRREREKRTQKFKKVEMDSILIFTPYYEKFDKKNKLDVISSLEGLENVSTTIGNMADQSQVIYKSLDMNNILNVSTEELNSIFLLNEWKEEMDESYEEQMVSMTQDRVSGVFKNLGYDKILMAGVYNGYEEKGFFSYVTRPTLALLFAAPLTPIFAFQQFQPNYYTYRYVQIIDNEGYIIFNRKQTNDEKQSYKQDELFFQDVFDQLILKK